MTTSVAHQIPECIVNKIMLQTYHLSPHPTAKIIKHYASYFLWSQFCCISEEDEIDEYKRRYNNGEELDDELEKIDIYTWDKSIGMNTFKTAPHQADETDWYNKYINRTPRLDFYTNEVIRE